MYFLSSNLLFLFVGINFVNCFTFNSSINLTRRNPLKATDVITSGKSKVNNQLFFNTTGLQSSTKASSQKNGCSYKKTLVQCLTGATFRTFDGSCNNLQNPWWGSKNVPFRRLSLSVYADGIFLPRSISVTGVPLPSPREISNVCSRNVDNRTEVTINSLFTTYGQFIDHDLTSTVNGADDAGNPISCQCREPVRNPFCMNIPTPDMPDQVCILSPRSSDLFKQESECQHTVREQVNQINSYLDGSMIYGSDVDTSDQLRNHSLGLLKTTSQNLPPQRPGEGGSCLGAQKDRGCFLCGDTRANENMGLASLHAVFIRFHNKLALSLSTLNPLWSDDMIYFETRRIVTAVLQHLTYNEFLPVLLGRTKSNFGPFLYQPSVDATIFNEFAAAAFRFGHTLVNPFIRRFNQRREMIEELSLTRIIFSPTEAYNERMGGLDTILLGFLLTPASNFGPTLNNILRNRLFEAPTPKPHVETKRLDLLAVNINRGRDHGLPTYNMMRQQCGLRRATSFDDLRDTINPPLIEKLSSVYAHVEDIDLYIGGLSERSLGDAVVGPTFACIIGEQFRNLRRGDRFFYETQNPALRFTREQLNEIQRVTISSLLCQNIDGVNEIQRQALKMPNPMENQFVSCLSFPPFNLSFWREKSI